MLCNQCGASLPDDATFCNNCGAPVAQPQYQQPQQPQYQQPQYQQPQYQQPAPYQQPQPMYAQPMDQGFDPQEASLSKSILTMGILSICFCLIIAVLGVVFGGIALGKSNAYAQKYQLVGKAKTGRILGTIGMILGIINGVLGIIIMLANS